MNYQNKSFSVSISMSQESWDRIFGKKENATTTAGEVVPDAPAPAPEPVLEDLSERQCAACLERGGLYWVDAGLIQCSTCLARFPQGVEQNMKVPADKACSNCGGTGRLRSSFTVFACGACGGTGARGA